MCANIGVDPLASNKGMWAQLLGFGDFYYELGVQIVEACLATRAYNGGFMELGALRNAVQVKLDITALPVGTEMPVVTTKSRWRRRYHQVIHPDCPNLFWKCCAQSIAGAFLQKVDNQSLQLVLLSLPNEFP